MIDTHIAEYRQQIEQHKQAIVALQGAIQALERLKQESKKDGNEQNSNKA